MAFGLFGGRLLLWCSPVSCEPPARIMSDLTRVLQRSLQNFDSAPTHLSLCPFCFACNYNSAPRTLRRFSVDYLFIIIIIIVRWFGTITWRDGYDRKWYLHQTWPNWMSNLFPWNERESCYHPWIKIIAAAIIKRLLLTILWWTVILYYCDIKRIAILKII